MSDRTAWRPTATRDILENRARQLAWVRGFFSQRDVLEVETPVLGRHGVSDVNLDGIRAEVMAPGVCEGWLQTSPEYHMKRLLAAGSGSIYQISKVFRNGERGRRHNPEFSMLEWYRLGWDDRALMAEVGDLVCGWLDCERPEVIYYRDAVRRFAGFDPMTVSQQALIDHCERWMPADELRALGRDGCLDLVMSLMVEPALGVDRPVFITGYPASQAALARVSEHDGFPVAHRFELYIQGVELCNGYWELLDAGEQRRRFDADNARRRQLGKPVMPIDEALMAALDSGLPECAGVALGLDRLLMLKVGADRIDDVLAFPIERA
ncbi:MAG: EF-P lysine aminoacylase GenX [Marinobacter sp. 34-60-7]|nr:MAG: EF-P lysine aminoacylase GenX [Marinobacter sp. 34-60-7]